MQMQLEMHAHHGEIFADMKDKDWYTALNLLFSRGLATLFSQLRTVCEFQTTSDPSMDDPIIPPRTPFVVVVVLVAVPMRLPRGGGEGARG